MRHGNGKVVGNGQYFWPAVLVVAVLAAVLIALGAGKPWGKSAVIRTIVAVLALLIVYELAYVLSRRRIAAWTAQGEYPKALALAVRLSKWYYGGRNASAHHAAAANILFQMEEDERFRQETEQITAPRFLFLKVRVPHARISREPRRPRRPRGASTFLGGTSAGNMEGTGQPHGSASQRHRPVLHGGPRGRSSPHSCAPLPVGACASFSWKSSPAFWPPSQSKHRRRPPRDGTGIRRARACEFSHKFFEEKA